MKAILLFTLTVPLTFFPEKITKSNYIKSDITAPKIEPNRRRPANTSAIVLTVLLLIFILPFLVFAECGHKHTQK